MLRYAITSRALYSGPEQVEGEQVQQQIAEQQKQAALLAEAARWIADGIDFIQLREKDLPAATLAHLTRNLLETIARTESPTRLLLNSRPDIALATGAHGVHLTASPDELSPIQIRDLYLSARAPKPLITLSCHNLAEVHRAHSLQIDAILFAPVFEKPLAEGENLPGQGLDQLRAACLAAAPIPVFALGGVTPENAPECLKAGAAGVAGIRLFHRLPHNAS